MLVNLVAISAQPQRCELLAPFGRGVTETFHADAPRKTPVDSRLDQTGREERQRDGHIDVTNAAFFASSDLLGSEHYSGDDLILPPAPPRDRCNKFRPLLGADRPRAGSWR